MLTLTPSPRAPASCRWSRTWTRCSGASHMGEMSHHCRLSMSWTGELTFDPLVVVGCVPTCSVSIFLSPSLEAVLQHLWTYSAAGQPGCPSMSSVSDDESLSSHGDAVLHVFFMSHLVSRPFFSLLALLLQLLSSFAAAHVLSALSLSTFSSPSSLQASSPSSWVFWRTSLAPPSLSFSAHPFPPGLETPTWSLS